MSQWDNAKMYNMLKTADREAKWTEIWDSG